MPIPTQEELVHAQRHVLDRIRDLRRLLDSVEARVRDPLGPLNTLGELQAEPVKLDCAIVILAHLRQKSPIR